MSFRVAIFSLNQWALDFEGNTKRIIRSIDQAYEVGSIYRAGPELELSGYSLEDAFFENDTVQHCWSCIGDILKHSRSIDMVIDVGMPVHFTALYNCRVIIYKGQILCIRAKTSLAKEGNYREYRHFKEWPIEAGVVAFRLPPGVSADHREFVPFGANFILELASQSDYHGSTLKIGWEICQELWDLKNVSSDLYGNFGCHLVLNGSGSYWELRKLDTITDMIKGISLRGGACYAFSNLLGCDGQRYVFYGRSCIYDKGRLVAMTPTSSDLFHEIQMITHDVNPRDIEEYRAQTGIRPNASIQAGPVWKLMKPPKDPSMIDSSYRTFLLKVNLKTSDSYSNSLQIERNFASIRFEQEIYYYVSLWLWDYLRRSGMRGFMMPLSGGLDSSTVAVLVYCMCNLLHEKLDEFEVRDYFEKAHNISASEVRQQLPGPSAICEKILKCSYISTQFSSRETEGRARLLSRAIGADFSCVSIQDIYTQCRSIGGLDARNMDVVSLLDQNIQARLRMTVTYYLSGGNRIVLATGNVDEGIMGYLTKYDCSSADINPIGGLCKEDLKSFLKYCCSDVFKGQADFVRSVQEIIEAPPSAELTGSEQRDEDEIGITYDEISVLGRVRRGIYGVSGPKGAFETVWRNRNKPPFSTKMRCLKSSRNVAPSQVASELAELIKRFYQRYTRNRHKLTVLTPALHAETYSPDDNRFDHRQFLYPPMTYQFKCIDDLVERIKRDGDLM